MFFRIVFVEGHSSLPTTSCTSMYTISATTKIPMNTSADTSENTPSTKQQHPLYLYAVHSPETAATSSSVASARIIANAASCASFP